MLLRADAGWKTAMRRDLHRQPAKREDGSANRRERSVRESDAKLIELLKANAREPAASLARKLGVARSTVQDRIARLEREGTIAGYTVKMRDGAATKIRAIVMIATDSKRADRTAAELRKMLEVRALYAVAGSFDLVATIETDTTGRMDAVLDRIGRTHGVARTVSSVVLSEKFARL